MNSPLARYLRDFGAEAVRVEVPQPIAFPEVDAEPEIPLIEPFVPQIDLEAERREAFDQGHQAASDTLASQHADELAALAEKHAEELKVQRQTLEAQMADQLAKALPDLADRISSELVEASLRLFAPILKDATQRRSVEDLALQMKPMLAKDVTGQIRVSGPEPLCLLLGEKLEEQGETITFVHTEGPEVKVEIGDSLFVTRLSSFASEIERLLA